MAKKYISKLTQGLNPNKKSMADLSANQNILITGGTSGLGFELVRIFLNKGFNVTATGRQPTTIPDYADRFKLFLIDFSDLNQVDVSMKKICETYDFDFVINNAGILSPPGFTPTINGLEITFQVNYLSHLLINEIILRKAKDNHPVKIATVTSPVYRLADTNLTIQSGSTGYKPFRAYASSKLYLTLMCEFLPLRYPGMNLQCFSFNPGTFSSGIYRMQKKWFRSAYRMAAPFMRNPKKVADNLADMLMGKNVKNGSIYDTRKHFVPVPSIDKKEKETFMRVCYEIINPFLS